MILKREDPSLLQISQIKNITSISFCDIYAYENSSYIILPGFIITYGANDTFLFLTTHDKYFEEFVKKVREVYLAEQNQVISEGIFGKEYLMIDDLSKEILLNGNLDNLEEQNKIYQGKDTYQESLFFEEDSLALYFPLIKYALEEGLKSFNKTITTVTLSSGTNGVYYITAFIDKVPVILPLYFTEQENEWHLAIGNIFENSIPWQINWRFSENSLKIQSFINEYGYMDDITFTASAHKLKKMRTIFLQDKMILYNEEEAKEEHTIPEKYLSLCISDATLQWYSLPWGAFIGYKENDQIITADPSRQHHITENRLIYLGTSANDFIIKDLASKYYQKKIDDRTRCQKVILNRWDKTIKGKALLDKMILETYFAEGGVTSFYKTYLAANYFYQIADKELKENRFIGRNDGLIEKSDLEDEKIYSKKVGI